MQRVWVTQREAAGILGCHVSLIGKLVAKGELPSRGQGVRGSLDHDEVFALTVARREVAVRRSARAEGAYAAPASRH